MNPEVIALIMLLCILIPIVGYIAYSHGKIKGVQDFLLKKRIDDMRFK